MRPYERGDGEKLAARLHPTSLGEMGETRAERLPMTLNAWAQSGDMTTGLVDGEVLFVAGSFAPRQEGGPRPTLFLFAKGHDPLIGFALRRWVRAERRRHPGARGATISLGGHPLKERFLSLIGAERVADGAFLT